VLAAVLVKNPGGFRPGQPADRAVGVLRDAWRSPPVRAWLLSALIGGAAVDALILYQVPVTARAGLPLESRRQSPGSAAWPSWTGGFRSPA
jgi:hypothetical protein